MGRRDQGIISGSVMVVLKEVMQDDLSAFFEHQMDPVANKMAAFTSKDLADKDAFDSHWSRILADETIIARTILVGGQVAGHVATFERSGDREVTYWLGREYWGNGVATEALKKMLGQVKSRPLYARAATDNIASIRVLEKCGFMIQGYEKAFANARGEEIEEVLMVLT